MAQIYIASFYDSNYDLDIPQAFSMSRPALITWMNKFPDNDNGYWYYCTLEEAEKRQQWQNNTEFDYVKLEEVR